MKHLLGFLLSVAACFSLGAQTNQRPNLILVMADDLGYGDLSCYGQKAFRTPYLDLLAAEGMRFTQAYSGSTVCAPARSTLLTGKHTGHTSVRSNTGGVPLLDADVTIAEVLKEAGYATGGFGKWGLGDLDTEGVPEKQGFDRFFGYYHQIHAHSYYPDYLIDTGRKVPLPGNKDFLQQHPGDGPKPDMNGTTAAEFSYYRIKREMFDWIRGHKDRPFFCYAPWTLPHAGWHLPESDVAWQLAKELSRETTNKVKRPLSLPARVHAAFTLMIDRDIGELIELLKELGIEDQTLILFCSDNGPDERFDGELDSAGPLRGFKRSLFEGGLRVPFIARWPGVITPAQTCALPVYFPDLLPTFAQLAGASRQVPADVDGFSLVPLLAGRPQLQIAHRYLYWEYTPINWAEGASLELEKTAQAIRLDSWKAIRETQDGPIALYDLSRDLGETNNVARANPQMMKELVPLFKQLRTEMRPQPEPRKEEGLRFR
jgi:arylsulfatase A-like enzyme